jgi:S-methylmethionine-dependent homocysteine/selenocysteine methylase
MATAPALPLHHDAASEALVRDYFLDYLRIGATHGYGLVIETLTWRASRDRGSQLAYGDARLRAANERAVAFLRELRDRDAGSPVVVSGCIGPRGDAYSDLGRVMSTRRSATTGRRSKCSPVRASTS